MKIAIGRRLSDRSETRRRDQLGPGRADLWIPAGLFVVASLSCGAFSVRATDPAPTISVKVFNYTEAAPASVVKAEGEAGRIFRDTGLTVVWLNCPVGPPSVSLSDPCEQPLLLTDIVVRVLSDHNRGGIQDDAFGFAVLPAVASVYYERAVHLARTDGAGYEVPMVLACVMVHEIGHLLLGPGGHSESGIMQGHWGRQQVRMIMRGRLRFTAQQSRLVKAQAQTRMEHESAHTGRTSPVN